MAYRDLPLKERHAFIRECVANGVHNLRDIEAMYDSSVEQLPEVEVHPQANGGYLAPTKSIPNTPQSVYFSSRNTSTYGSQVPVHRFEEGGDKRNPIVQGMRQRLYDNVIPFGYNDPVRRVFNAIVRNKKELYDDAYGVSDDTKDVLDDLWGTYLNIPEYKRHHIHSSNGIIRSVGPDPNKTYYQLNNLDPIIDELTLVGLGDENRYQKYPGGDWNYLYRAPLKLGEVVPADFNNQVLGKYDIGRGYDDRGEYLSYSDAWDINPFQNAGNSRIYGADRPSDDNWIQSLIRKVAPEHGDASFGVGTPVNIYGKVYLDDIYGVPTDKRGTTYLPEVTVWGDKKSQGGPIHIAPSKRGTFTAAATKHGKSVQAFASQVLAHKENYSPAMVKKAVFAHNSKSWKHADGGYLVGKIYDVDEQEYNRLISAGYEIEVL